MSMSDIRQHTLANGLRVLLAPSRDAPVASFWVIYGVGSRNELPGLTGISHWVEHMMFKKTDRPGSGDVMLLVNREGGTNNAFTSNDYTAYHETLPSDRIAMAVEIEADRMTGVRFDPDETETERTVILSELQMYQDNPSYMLWEQVEQAAFSVHPYGHPVIGYEHDLRSMSRDDLYGHYRRHYAPANATVIVSGDIDPDGLLATIEQHFGSIPAGERTAAVRAAEPAPRSEHRVTLRRPAPAPEVILAYHVPSAAHEDTAALQVLSAVLSGSGSGRSSRLYRALVASGKAASAWSHASLSIDPTLFLVGAGALPGGDIDEIEAILRAELARVTTEPVGAAELARAKQQLVASLAYGAESVTNQASWIAQWAALGDPNRAKSFIDELRAVTAERVQAVLDIAFPTVGQLVPTMGSAPVGGDAPVVAMRRAGLHGPGGGTPFERTRLGNGIAVLTQAQPADPVVTARLRVPAGSAHDPADRHGTASLTALLASRGTGSRTREQFDQAVDDLGLQLSIASGREFVEASLTCLAGDLAIGLDLVAEALLDPALSPDELERARHETLAAIAQAEDDTSTVAGQGLRDLLFPAGHPLRHSPLGAAEAVASISADEVRGFHTRHYHAGGMVVAGAGGFADGATLARLIEDRFGASVAEARPEVGGGTVLSDEGGRSSRPIDGKQQVDISLGMLIPSLDHPEAHVFEIGNAVLGQLGMMGRIGERVREREGMAYYAYSMVQPGSRRATWLASAGVDPSNVDATITAILDVVTAMRGEPIHEEELRDAQRYLTGVLPLRLETNAGIARLLMTIEQFGLGLDYVATYPERIRGVTLEDVRRILASWLDPSRVSISTAGAIASGSGH